MDQQLAELCEMKTFQKGVTVVKQGEEADGIFVIRSGNVEVIRDNQIIANLGEGDFFGAMGVLLKEKRSADVRVASEMLDTYFLSNKAYEKAKATLEPEVLDKALERYKETFDKYR